MSYETCAYENGDSDSPYACPWTNDYCTYSGANWGCVNSASTLYPSCVSNGGSSIQGYLSCDAESPACVTYYLSRVGETSTLMNFGCAAHATKRSYLNTYTNGPATVSASPTASGSSGASSATSTAAGPSNTAGASSSSGGTLLSTSTILGIAFGAVGVIGVIAAVWMCCRMEQWEGRNRREREVQRLVGQEMHRRHVNQMAPPPSYSA